MNCLPIVRFVRTVVLASFIAVLCTLFAPAHAGAEGGGKITALGSNTVSGYPTAVYFGITPVPAGRASCNTNAAYQFVFDPTTPAGKVLYAAILLAEAEDRTLTVGGTGVCELGHSMEGVSYWFWR